MKNLLFSLLLLHLVACRQHETKRRQELMVFAGVGMKNAVSEIVDSFKIHHPKLNVLCNWAPSGILAKQIAQGQIPGVFISANKKWADYVDSLRLILPAKRMVVAKNELVVVVPQKSQMDSICFNENTDFKQLLHGGFLSIGDPSFVPVGAYAKQSLQHYGLYTSLRPKLMPAKDVRSALWVVELGEAPAGIVFRSEALASEQVKVVATISSVTHKPITFIAAQCKSDKQSSSFYRFLGTSMARSVWVKHGFY